MKRLYELLLQEHFKNDRQMVFITGPRQVGKTTTCRVYKENQIYLNWDNEDDRLLILNGPKAVFNNIELSSQPTVIFDELHKYPNWKNFIKGFYDTYIKEDLEIIVTGSAKFNVYRKGLDSLMGRFFSYRMHPLSVGEMVHKEYLKTEIQDPTEVKEADFNNLITYGGFPEPFLKRNKRFYNKWKLLRKQLLFREEIRDVTKIHEINQVEVLAELLIQQASQVCNYASLSRKIRASENSIRNWINTLESLYFCFLIRPWSKNISRSLLKEPKIYLWDWSIIREQGALYESIIASHLLKSIHWWQDNGFGEYSLHYLRTKDKREVDFLIVKNSKPWFLVEVKSKKDKISNNLGYFQELTGAKHAFQVVFNTSYQNSNCFSFSSPINIPAITFLSQLV